MICDEEEVFHKNFFLHSQSDVNNKAALNTELSHNVEVFNELNIDIVDWGRFMVVRSLLIMYKKNREISTWLETMQALIKKILFIFRSARKYVKTIFCSHQL